MATLSNIPLPQINTMAVAKGVFEANKCIAYNKLYYIYVVKGKNTVLYPDNPQRSPLRLNPVYSLRGTVGIVAHLILFYHALNAHLARFHIHHTHDLHAEMRREFVILSINEFILTKPRNISRVALLYRWFIARMTFGARGLLLYAYNNNNNLNFSSDPHAHLTLLT